MTLFLLCSYFRAHPTTLLLKILRGRMHGPSPHLEFWGDRPPVSPRSPPLVIDNTRTLSSICILKGSSIYDVHTIIRFLTPLPCPHASTGPPSACGRPHAVDMKYI